MPEQKILVIEAGGGDGYRAALVEGNKITVLGIIIPSSSLAEIIELVELRARSKKPSGIVFSTSGFISDGVITKSTNLGIPANTPLRKLIVDATQLPTLIVNDVAAGGRGGGIIFPGLDYYICANVGGGVGQSVFKNGCMVSANEQGHMSIDPSPFALPCACGLSGCVESLIGGRSLTRRVDYCMNALKISRPENTSSCAVLDAAYLQNAPWAVKIYKQFALAFGIYLANMILGTNAPDIIFRGTTALKSLQLEKIGHREIEQWVRQSMMAHLPDKTWGASVEFHYIPERREQPKDYDAILGAAALGRELLT
jgi:predicted NBD/HSP70 family sugar kinase